jgi:hypothetical protein
MLSRVSIPLSASSRVVLTGLSGLLVLGAALVFLLGRSPASAAVIQPGSPAVHAQTSSRLSVQAPVRPVLYDHHAWHMLHEAHEAYLRAMARQQYRPVTVAAVARPAEASYSGGGGFQSCVISRESGGNPDAQNPVSTASGLYGFLDTTWTAVTGLPGPARDYSAAQQTAAFWKLYAEAGTSPWGPSDGC